MRYDITHINGNINGRSFTGEGKGSFDTDTSVSEGRIVFLKFPNNYMPLLCRSWRCKHHPCVPPKNNPQLKLFPRRNYDLDETVIYISGASGKIHTTGKVREIFPETTEAFSEFNGWYNGPLDVATIPIHRETFTPIESGIYHICGYRMVEIKNKTTVETQWYGKLILHLQEGDEWNPLAFTQEYQLKSWNWKWSETESILDKVVEVSKLVEEMVTSHPVNAEEVSIAYELYRKIEEYKLSQIGLTADQVPIFTLESFQSFLENNKMLVLGAWRNNQLVGLGVASLETECDDLLFPPYGDILCLAVNRNYLGLGVESHLFSNLSIWLKEKGCKVIRTTIPSGIYFEELLWESLGVKPVVIRGQIKLP